MTKAERIRAALSGKPVDHVPASFWFHFPEKNKAGQAMADAHLKYYEACDPDWLKVMNDTRYDLVRSKPNSDGIYDLKVLADPVPLSDPCFEMCLDGLRRIVKGLGKEVPTIVTIFCPFATLNYSTGNTADDLIRRDPDAAETAIAAIAESLAVFSRACIDEGAWGIFFSAQGGEKDRMSTEQHARFVQKYDRVVLDAVKDSPFSILHVCGENLSMDPYWDYPAQCLNWLAGPASGNPTITEARKKTTAALAAGLHNEGPLSLGPNQAIEEEVRKAMEEGGKEKFLLSAGCTVPNDTNWDHLKLARKACIEFSN